MKTFWKVVKQLFQLLSTAINFDGKLHPEQFFTLPRTYSYEWQQFGKNLERFVTCAFVTTKFMRKTSRRLSSNDVQFVLKFLIRAEKIVKNQVFIFVLKDQTCRSENFLIQYPETPWLPSFDAKYFLILCSKSFSHCFHLLIARQFVFHSLRRAESPLLVFFFKFEYSLVVR